MSPAVVGVRVVAVANVRPGTGKSAAARALYDRLRGCAPDVALWDCSGRVPPPPVHTMLPGGGIVVVDTGSAPRSESWRWAARVADQLVIPVPVDRAAARAAAWMCQSLDAQGHGALVRSAITVTSAHHRRDRALAGLIRSYFGRYTSGVVEVPETWPAIAVEVRRRLAATPARNAPAPLAHV